MLVTSELLLYYRCLSVYVVQLTDYELFNTFTNEHNCLLTRLLLHLSRQPSSSCPVTNHMHSLVRATHCGIQLNVTTSDVPSCLKFFLERQSEWKLLLSPCFQGLLVSGYCRCTPQYFTLCPCIIGYSQLDRHFLLRLLAGYSKLKDSWRNDFPPLSEGFLNGPLL